mmetsp:Transcript_18391/g.42429  ORF Transcript_18391/g.42429 Transcript_18391/m.42429 type:complete len:476 (+) Transcript_18391:2-1429(+)
MKITTPTGSYSCGGSLIAPDVILTAAHCNDPYDEGNVERGYVGATRFWSTLNGAEVGTCVEWKNHPNYVEGEYTDEGYVVPGTSSLGGNDLALCKLYAPVTIDASEVFLELNEDPDVPGYGDVLETMGMEQSYINLPNTYYRNPRLLRTDLPWLDPVACDGFLGGIVDETTMTCTYDPSAPVTGTCFGDSGSPVVLSERTDDGRTKHTQIGVASWGDGYCGIKPDVQARVSAGIGWIKDAVCGEWESTDASFCEEERPFRCPDGETVFAVRVQTDAYPEENSWTLWDLTTADGEIAASNDLLRASSNYTDTACLKPGSFYNWILTDTRGDGLCVPTVGCFGSYSLTVNGEEVFSGDSFGFSTAYSFLTPTNLTANPTVGPTADECVDEPGSISIIVAAANPGTGEEEVVRAETCEAIGAHIARSNDPMRVGGRICERPIVIDADDDDDEAMRMVYDFCRYTCFLAGSGPCALEGQ